jgi:hypothetical protein
MLHYTLKTRRSRKILKLTRRKTLNRKESLLRKKQCRFQNLCKEECAFDGRQLETFPHLEKLLGKCEITETQKKEHMLRQWTHNSI